MPAYFYLVATRVFALFAIGVAFVSSRSKVAATACVLLALLGLASPFVPLGVAASAVNGSPDGRVDAAVRAGEFASTVDGVLNAAAAAGLSTITLALLAALAGGRYASLRRRGRPVG
jgi:hypothetical protein